MKKVICSLGIFVSLLAIMSGSYAGSIEGEISGKIDIVVSQDGTGDFLTIQEAINAVPDSSMDTTVIFIRNGVYYEKILVPYSKINITLIGQDVDSTILTYDDYPAILPDGSTFGTTSFRAEADNFCAMNITFANSAGDAGQALAFSSYGDKQMFYHCRFLGWQDTYFINYRLRNYMKDCYIEGAVDYIYGYGIGVYDSCQIHTIRSGGVITAASSSIYNRFGLTFKNCRLTTPSGVSGIFLGRPWQGKPHVAYMFCDEPESLNPSAWTVMGPGLDPVFAEYKCTGPGYEPDKRSTVADYPGIQLTDEEALEYASTDTLFAASSFASQEEDSLEIQEMFMPFFEADLTELILDVMKRGRDTFPDIPTDDWELRPHENEFIQVIKANFPPFLDSIYMLGPQVENILIDGDALEGFDPAILLYGIEMADGDTVAPLMDIIAENCHYNITYPDELPGFSEVTVSSFDYTTHVNYKIFNSVDSAYWNAELTFLGYNRSDTIQLVPGVYTYEVLLDPDVSGISSIQVEQSFSGSTYKKTLPSQIPGTATVVVTSIGKTIEKTYTINFSYATGIGHQAIENSRGDVIISNPVTDQGFLRLIQPMSGILTLRIFDLTGKLVKTVNTELGESENFIVLDFSDFLNGVYFYQIKLNNTVYSGKIAKMD